MGGEANMCSLRDVLDQKQIKTILDKVLYNSECEVVGSDVRGAGEGLVGFLGEHARVTLHVRGPSSLHTLHLFVKQLPARNKPKADFIHRNHYFTRESIMYELFDEMNAAHEPNPWCPEAYLHSDCMLVLRDLTPAGYRSVPALVPLDVEHAVVAAAAVARFHATFANHHTRRNKHAPYDFYQQHRHVLHEPTFCDSPWLRTCAKLSADLLDEFSTQYNTTTVPELQCKLERVYLAACDSLRLEEGTLNVALHKDLWANNILYRYEGGRPEGAVLIDYQCVRYAPPAFDLMAFLYLNTDRTFRDHHERDILDHYYSVFSECLEEETRRWLEGFGYGREVFLEWCERSRMFGAFEAIGIFPFVLMEGRRAQQVFDDPETYATVIERDRSRPVIEHARECAPYRHRQLDLTHEFIERYILNTATT